MDSKPASVLFAGFLFSKRFPKESLLQLENMKNGCIKVRRKMKTRCPAAGRSVFARKCEKRTRKSLLQTGNTKNVRRKVSRRQET